MRKFTFSFKSLLVACLLMGGAGSAWGETVASLGNVDESDATNNKTYVVAPNKTLTLSFTVNSTKGQNETQGYTVELRNTGDANQKMYMQPGGGFYYWGDDWWAETHIVKNDRSWANLSDFTTLIPGASVKLTIKRIHTQVLYYADIMTTSSVRHYRRLISSEGTFVENTNLDVKLGANNAVLTSITDEVTDESITGTLIGKEDNSVGFGTNNFEYTLSENSSVSLHFINYSSKIGNDDNWLLEIQKGDKYLDLRASGAGWQSNSDYYDESNFTKESTTGEYADNFPVALHKADVNLTVTRSGKTITMQAVQECASGEVKTLTYTLTHNDFASGDVTVRLMADWSHLDLLPVPATISAAGYATFSSPYALDLTTANTPEGLTAYYIGSGLSKNNAPFTAINQTVEAGQGILLKGAANTTYNIKVAASGTPLPNNALVATNGNPIPAGNYVFAYETLYPSTTAGFYYVSAATSPVAAGKAYLNGSAVPKEVKSFIFGDDTATGVEAPVAAEAEEDGVYYNLNGQQVTKDYKGIVIVNGKKFFNK